MRSVFGRELLQEPDRGRTRCGGNEQDNSLRPDTDVGTISFCEKPFADCGRQSSYRSVSRDDQRPALSARDQFPNGVRREVNRSRVKNGQDMSSERSTVIWRGSFLLLAGSSRATAVACSM